MKDVQSVIDEQLQALRQIAADRAANPRPAPAPVAPAPRPAPAPGAQLPIWPEAVRGAPNELLRSALFCAKSKRTPRAYLRRAQVACLFEGHITFTGEELRQDDETVWFELVHQARGTVPGSMIEFTPHAFCKAVAWPISERSYERLRLCLERLQSTALAVYSKRLKRGVSLSMLPFFEWRDESQRALKRYRVRVAPELLPLFDVHYSRIEWQQRLALPTGIATWLHGYYASSRTPYPASIETLKRGAGITTESPRKARQLIDRALRELVRVGFLISYTIDGTTVKVQRVRAA